MILAKEVALYQPSAIAKGMERTFTLADGKARVFYTSLHPDPPYDAGDIWVYTYQKDGNDVLCIYTCTRSVASGGEFLQEDWELAATDDTVAIEALNLSEGNEGLIEYIMGLLEQYATYEEFEQKEVELESRIADLDWGGYLKLYGKDGGTPVVIIGDEAVVPIVMKVTNGSLGFYKKGEATAVAYFGQSADQNLFGLIAGMLKATKYMDMGRFRWIINSDGGLTVKKVD